jgi:Domain of unknown function (DUF4112)
MPNPSEPQVLPPSHSQSGLSDESLDIVASLLDDVFHIPGTNLRFGLDPIIGLVPGLGDAISGFASFLIVFAAWQRRLPRVTIARMVANIGVDTLVGSIPFLGDAFDAAWKSNRKNVTLLKRAQYDPRGRQVFTDWLFLLGIVLILAALVMVPLLVLWFLIHLLRH